MKDKVLLGMSGGVDSSVTAMMLQERGYEVTGITFIFGGDPNSLLDTAREAEKLATRLGIKHITADVRKDFKQIVEEYFISDYKVGKTPFPCAVCNPKVKFKYLNLFASQLDCNYISTGHYARIGSYNNKYFLFQGVDPDKDQSFFLWGLQGHVVEKLILPLGEFFKSEIRENAKRNGFNSLSKRKDSLGICFIKGNDYRNYLKNNGLDKQAGYFVNRNGKILGKHWGISNYTIGQRRGLGIQASIPLFVSEIRAENNEIVLEEYDALYKTKILINNYYFVDLEEINPSNTFNVKIRYRLQNTSCKIQIINENLAEIILLEPLAMVANGQTTVFYDNNRVVGGGFILSSE